MNTNKSLSGLTEAEALRRRNAGLGNSGGQISSKSAVDIIRTNIFTFFNLINCCLAVAVIIVGSYKSVLFMGVVFWNALIGTIQEIRAKRMTDKLTLISQPRAEAVRDGETKSIEFKEIVKGDLLKISAGMQVCADCEIKAGTCEADESLLTGESEPGAKSPGDILLSGSFIVSGEVYAEAVRVGADNFSGRITAGAKFFKRPESKMFRSMEKIVKGISLVILPIMAALLYQSLFVNGEPVETAVTSAVAAVVGMIPGGLILLISAVMAVSTMRLAKHRVLVQNLYCIETLARTDVLCIDKTGTITQGEMRVEETVLLQKHGYDISDVSEILSAFVKAVPDKNQTANAIRTRYNIKNDWQALKTSPFSSSKKWSGVYFKGKGAYILGAAKFILKENMPEELERKIDDYASKGQRVVLLAKSEFDFKGEDLPPALLPLALVIITDYVRENAPETMRYFKENGVEIKVISGDAIATVKNIAKQAGVANAERAITMHGIPDRDISAVAEQYTVFAETSPAQKLALINTLKNLGHTVGMTGDGVNDVLALKNADCSIAMQSGSDAARNVSDIILLDDDFSSIVKTAKEGRRCIGNIERSASLFLTKTVFSVIAGFVYALAVKPYPLVLIQMTFINALFIGLPSFLLALEPNKERINGGFIENVLKKAVPYGLCHVTCISLMALLGHIYRLTSFEIRAVAVLLFGVTSLLILCRVCEPFNKRRAFMVTMLGASFAAAVSLFEAFLEITAFSRTMLFILAILMMVSVAVTWYFPAGGELIIKKYRKIKEKSRYGKRNR